jgi:hypothetical protein
MINIILKNRSLIKIYKYSLIIFKFLNKHLYILSILSILAKARKSNYYKIFSWIIKIILVLNLAVSSGLFFSVVDLYTPFTTIKLFYNDLLGPYLELLRSKTNELSNLYSNVENKYVNNSIRINKELPSISNLPTIDNPIEIEEKLEFNINLKTIAFYSSIALFVYFFYFIPGASTPPTEIVQYNWFNQGLINVKVLAKDIWTSLTNYETITGGPRKPIVPKASDSFSPDIEIKSFSTPSSPISDPNTPIAGPSRLTPIETIQKVRAVRRFRKIKFNKSTQTNLTGDNITQWADYIISTTVSRATPQIDTDSNLLNSTQLLDEINEN